MGKYKIAVYAICKNEEKFVDKWLESMSEADAIYVTDTGSEDNTVEKLRAGGAYVQSVILSQWRFDRARNISLDFVPVDMDICVCTDLDEILEKGWRKLVEEAWKKNTTRLKYVYNWSINPDGTPATSFMYEKIHSRHGYKWIYPVHEVLEYIGKGSESIIEEKRLRLNHYPDRTKPRSQYLGLLELGAKENPNNSRAIHYLGREYMYYGMWDKCINTLKRHIEMPSSVWREERCASMRFIARAYKAKKEYREAERWLYRAIAEAPHLREPYVEMAMLAYDIKKWHMVYAMINEALAIKENPLAYINEGFCYNFTPYDLGSLAAFNLSMYNEALALARKAYEMAPDNNRLRDNVSIISKYAN